LPNSRPHPEPDINLSLFFAKITSFSNRPKVSTKSDAGLHKYTKEIWQATGRLANNSRKANLRSPQLTVRKKRLKATFKKNVKKLHTIKMLHGDTLHLESLMKLFGNQLGLFKV
jgi:hypothetical protein